MTEPVHIADELRSLFLVDPLERLPVVRSGGREPISSGTRYGIWLRDGGQCQWCGSRQELQVDHIVPWSNGGSDRTDNLRMLCASCNDARSNRRTDIWTTVLPLTYECHRCMPQLRSRAVDDEPAQYIEQAEPVRAFCLMCRAAGIAERETTR